MTRVREAFGGGFAAGVLVGLAAGAVAVVAIEATRRRRERLAASAYHEHRIDGIHPLNSIELATAPAPEGNESSSRLESESEVSPETSLRW